MGSEVPRRQVVRLRATRVRAMAAMVVWARLEAAQACTKADSVGSCAEQRKGSGRGEAARAS